MEDCDATFLKGEESKGETLISTMKLRYASGTYRPARFKYSLSLLTFNSSVTEETKQKFIYKFYVQ